MISNIEKGEIQLQYVRSTVKAESGEEIDPFSVLVLRVYIRDIHSSEIVICGSGALTLYNIEDTSGKRTLTKVLKLSVLSNYEGKFFFSRRLNSINASHLFKNCIPLNKKIVPVYEK